MKSVVIKIRQSIYFALLLSFGTGFLVTLWWMGKGGLVFLCYFCWRLQLLNCFKYEKNHFILVIDVCCLLRVCRQGT